jgi:hypothetical protein
MLVGCEIAQIVDIDFENTGLARRADHPRGEEPLQHLRKDRDDINAHGEPSASWSEHGRAAASAWPPRAAVAPARFDHI